MSKPRCTGKCQVIFFTKPLGRILTLALHSRHRHIRRVLCINYLAGFCPAGADCPDAHPRFELPSATEMESKMGRKITITCHYCQEPGHKVS